MFIGKTQRRRSRQSAFLIYGIVCVLFLSAGCNSKRDDQRSQKSVQDDFLPHELQRNAATNSDVSVEVQNSIGMKFVLIPSGTFMMGDDKSQAFTNVKLASQPVHRVSISKPFYIGIFEVTQAEYSTVIGGNPSAFKGNDRPVEQVSWQMANEFCAGLSEMDLEKKAGRTYRLPTEAEWEFACRGNSKGRYFFESENQMKEFANVANTISGTIEVGSRRCNPFGLYDTYGNIAEWCLDSALLYTEDEQIDPLAKSESESTKTAQNEEKVTRGGYWFAPSSACNSTFRLTYPADTQLDEIGFRVVMEIN